MFLFEMNLPSWEQLSAEAQKAWITASVAVVAKVSDRIRLDARAYQTDIRLGVKGASHAKSI